MRFGGAVLFAVERAARGPGAGHREADRVRLGLGLRSSASWHGDRRPRSGRGVHSFLAGRRFPAFRGWERDHARDFDPEDRFGAGFRSGCADLRQPGRAVGDLRRGAGGSRGAVWRSAGCRALAGIAAGVARGSRVARAGGAVCVVRRFPVRAGAVHGRCPGGVDRFGRVAGACGEVPFAGRESVRGHGGACRR